MAFVKDMLRMWAHSWKRFISIAMITLLGVAVLTGIYAGCRDAFRSTDRFFDAQGLHDVQVLSTAGLSNGDIAALRKVNGVAKVQAERSQEVTFDLDGRKSATMQEIGTNGIDQPYLQEGRMPKKAGEIAVTRKFIRDSGKRIGSRLTVTPESASSDTSDMNDTNGADGTNETSGTDEAPSFPTKLTIVGVVLDPQNLSNPDGYSAMTSFRSTATTDYTFFAPSDGVTGTLYTSATLLVKGAAAESTFDESYENTVKQVTDRIDGTVKPTARRPVGRNCSTRATRRSSTRVRKPTRSSRTRSRKSTRIGSNSTSRSTRLSACRRARRLRELRQTARTQVRRQPQVQLPPNLTKPRVKQCVKPSSPLVPN